jgi:dipeptidyl aminopeptidase/acylaminoacyl peptidase
LAYVQKSETSNLQRIAFDPATGRTAGDPQPVTQGARYVTSPNLSPDDEWFVYSSQGETQEDLWLLKRDGAEQRQLTNDAAHDRAPRWSPDGQRIAFYSDRSGRFEVWLINADGTGLRQITFTQGPPTFYPLWSPDGARLLYKQREAQPAIIETARPWAEQTPVALPLIAGRGADFWPSAWSPDGGKLAGSWVMKPLRHHNLHIYDFATDSYENLGIAGTRPVWLNDQRRLLYLRDGKLRLADINAKQTREVLSPTPYSIGTACPARDNRTLYYTLQKTEADIWLWSLE